MGKMHCATLAILSTFGCSRFPALKSNHGAATPAPASVAPARASTSSPNSGIAPAAVPAVASALIDAVEADLIKGGADQQKAQALSAKVRTDVVAADASAPLAMDDASLVLLTLRTFVTDFTASGISTALAGQLVTSTLSYVAENQSLQTNITLNDIAATTAAAAAPLVGDGKDDTALTAVSAAIFVKAPSAAALTSVINDFGQGLLTAMPDKTAVCMSSLSEGLNVALSAAPPATAASFATAGAASITTLILNDDPNSSDASTLLQQVVPLMTPAGGSGDLVNGLLNGVTSIVTSAMPALASTVLPAITEAVANAQTAPPNPCSASGAPAACTATVVASGTATTTIDLTCVEGRISSQLAAETTLDVSSNAIDLGAAVAACQPQAALALAGLSNLTCMQGRMIQYFIETAVVNRCFQASLPPSLNFYKPVTSYADAGIQCLGTDGALHEAVNLVAWGCVHPY